MKRRLRLPLATLSHTRSRVRRERFPRASVLVGAIAVGLAVAAAKFWSESRRETKNLSFSLAAAEVRLPPTPPIPPAEAPNAEPLVPLPAATPSVPPVPPAVASPLPPPLERDFQPRPPRDTFEAQIALARDAICPGSIDGVAGGQTRNAFVAFQQKHGLRVTGILDNETRAALLLREAPLTTYAVSEADVVRLRPWPNGWEEKSKLDRLDYSAVLELVAEKHSAHPDKIKQLNPQITNWEQLEPGTVLITPHVRRVAPTMRPSIIVIHLSQKTLQLFDSDSRLLAHFPCSIARRVEKRPVGRIEIVTTAPNPNYTFDPANFPDSPEAQTVGRRLILQPGPNNPVGVAFMKLNLPGYGIHGSPEPEKIGRTESAGCFRLANWNAEFLLPLVYPGMPVQVEP